MAHKPWDGLNATAQQDSYHIAPNPTVGLGLPTVGSSKWKHGVQGQLGPNSILTFDLGRVTVSLACWPLLFCSPIKTASGGHL